MQTLCQLCILMVANMLCTMLFTLTLWSYAQAKQKRASCSSCPQGALLWCILAQCWCIVAPMWGYAVCINSIAHRCMGDMLFIGFAVLYRAVLLCCCVALLYCIGLCCCVAVSGCVAVLYSVTVLLTHWSVKPISTLSIIYASPILNQLQNLAKPLILLHFLVIGLNCKALIVSPIALMYYFCFLLWSWLGMGQVWATGGYSAICIQPSPQNRLFSLLTTTQFSPSPMHNTAHTSPIHPLQCVTIYNQGLGSSTTQ